MLEINGKLIPSSSPLPCVLSPQPGCTEVALAVTQPGLSSWAKLFQQPPLNSPRDSSLFLLQKQTKPFIIKSHFCYFKEEKDSNPEKHVGEENMNKNVWKEHFRKILIRDGRRVIIWRKERQSSKMTRLFSSRQRGPWEHPVLWGPASQAWALFPGRGRKGDPLPHSTPPLRQVHTGTHTFS